MARVNPAESFLKGFSTVKNLQAQEREEEFLKEKRQAFREERQFLKSERRRAMDERELTEGLNRIRGLLLGEDGTLDMDRANELVADPLIQERLLDRARTATGRSDIDAVRVIKPGGELARRRPELAGQTIAVARTADGSIVPVTDGDGDDAEVFSVADDNVPGIITAMAAEAGHPMFDDIVQQRRTSAQRERAGNLVDALGREQEVETGPDITDRRTSAQKRQLPPGGGSTVLDTAAPSRPAATQPAEGESAPAEAAMPDNDLSPDEVAVELDDTEEEIAATEEALATVREKLDGGGMGIVGTVSEPGQGIVGARKSPERVAAENRLATRRGELESRLEQLQQRRSALAQRVEGQRGQQRSSRLESTLASDGASAPRPASGQSPSQPARSAQPEVSEQQQLEARARENGRAANRIRAQLKSAQRTAGAYNQRIRNFNEKIDAISEAVRNGTIDAGSALDVVNDLKNPDVQIDVKGNQEDGYTVFKDGEPTTTVPGTGGGSGGQYGGFDSPGDLQLYRKRRAERADQVTKNVVDTLPEGMRGEQRRLISNTFAEGNLDPFELGTEGVLRQAARDLNRYTDDFGPDALQSLWGGDTTSAQFASLMPFIMARGMVGADASLDEDVLAKAQDNIDLVRNSLNEAGISSPRTEERTLTALVNLRGRGVPLNEATLIASRMIANRPDIMRNRQVHEISSAIERAYKEQSQTGSQ